MVRFLSFRGTRKRSACPFDWTLEARSPCAAGTELGNRGDALKAIIKRGVSLETWANSLFMFAQLLRTSVPVI